MPAGDLNLVDEPNAQRTPENDDDDDDDDGGGECVALACRRAEEIAHAGTSSSTNFFGQPAAKANATFCRIAGRKSARSPPLYASFVRVRKVLELQNSQFYQD